MVVDFDALEAAGIANPRERAVLIEYLDGLGFTAEGSTCWPASSPATPRRAPPTTSGATSSRTSLSTGERVYAYLFWDENKKASKYWRDVGTLDAYYEASMDLIAVDPTFNLYDPEWPLRTYQPQFPPAKFVFNEDGRRGLAFDSLIWMGCIISGSEIRHSILSPGVRVHSYCDIEDSILMYNATVRRHSKVRKAIIDREVLVPGGSRDRLRSEPKIAAATPCPTPGSWS